MASSSALSGLASGVDTSSIVDQLMAVERQAQVPITHRQTKVTAEQTALKAIATKLAAFQTAADALKKDGTAFTQTQAVTSSDPTKVVAAKISGAGVGGHTVQVDRLAASAQDGFVVGDTSAGGTIQIGASTFTFAAGATATNIADQLNGSSSSPVYAAVVKNAQGQERLVLSARSTGESSRFTATSPALTEDPLYASPAGSLNARYRVDAASTAQESETNTLDNVVPGLRLTLKGVTASPVSVTVDPPDIDRTAVTSRIKALVNAYNDVVTTTRAALDEKSVPRPTTTSELGKGTLFGDIGLDSMLSNLRTGLRQSLSGLDGVDSLADLGIDVPGATGGASTGDAKQGKLVVDDSKLATALNGDWTKVSAFLDRFAGVVGGYVKAQTGSAGSLIDGRVASDDSTLKQLSDQLGQLNDRLDSQQTRLQKQFAAMETALSTLQTQQAWLTSQIASLPRI